VVRGKATSLPVSDGWECTSVAISRDGSLVAGGGYVAKGKVEGQALGGARVFRNGTKLNVDVPFAPPSNGNGIAFSPNGNHVATIAPDGRIAIVDIARNSVRVFDSDDAA